MAVTSPIKLLFDENLARRLVQDLDDSFPGSAHVLTLGLGGADDRAIWAVAGREDFVLVTKNEDFHRLAVLLGPPPKVIWIRLGNALTGEVEQLLRARADDIALFVEQAETTFLALG